MAIKKLVLNTKTDMFGTTVTLESRDGSIRLNVGEQVPYDPKLKLVKKMDVGYLFRSPNAKPDDLSAIWETIEGFSGEACLTSEYDGKSEELTVYLRIKEKGDATMFAFSHNTFEKWSDAQDAEAKAEAKRKQKAVKGTVNDDGTVRVTVEVETLGD